MAQVPSSSPDDVPPATDFWITTIQGGLVRARANHQVAFVETGPNEQKVWFSVDVALKWDDQHPDPGLLRSYYNRRYRADSSSPWYWEFAFSQPVFSITGFVDTVLYSPMARYQDLNGHAWNYIMYTVNQPSLCNNHEFGIAMVQYSADGMHWYGTTPLRHPGGPTAECAPELGPNVVQVEALDAVDDGQGTIWLIGMEGDVVTLANPANMDQTFASWGTSAYATTSSVVIDGATCSITNAGISSPALPTAAPSRYTTYSYFFNMAMAWDPVNGDLYWTRGYPYPFDRHPEYGATVPSPDVTGEITGYNYYFNVDQLVGGCAPSPGIFPNRYQIYKMHLGSLSNFPQLHTGTWTLLADRGSYAGFNQTAVFGNGPGPLDLGQAPGDRDAGAASFLRDSSGYLVRSNGVGFVFGASTLMETMSAGPCRVTGNERLRVEPIGPPPPPTSPTGLYLVAACRVIDTRESTALANRGTRDVQIGGVCGIPSNAVAVAANITPISPSGIGFLSLYPTGSTWPGNDNIIYRTGKTRGNNAILNLSAGGAITVLNNGPTQHFVIDVTAYFK